MRTRHRLRDVLTSVTSVALCCALAACGGASDGASSSSGGGTSRAGVQAAEAAVTEYEAAPEDIPITEPLNGVPEAGQTFIWMTCQLTACVDMAGAVQAAVESVGWTYREISYDQATPATLVDSLRQALRYDPSYVGLSGVAPETWSVVIPEYEAAGVKLVTSYLGDLETDETVLANVAGPSLNELQAEALAQWFIADSQGEGNVLLQTVNDYPSNKILAEAFAATVAEDCPGCRVTEVNISLADAGAGGVVPTVISQLRANPNTEYLVSTYSPFLNGLPAQLQAAGLADRVKVAGAYADAGTKSAIQNGSFTAAIGTSARIAAYEMVDVALRDATGTPQPAEGHQLDIQLLTQDVEFEVDNQLDLPADYAQRFERLWGVS